MKAAPEFLESLVLLKSRLAALKAPNEDWAFPSAERSSSLELKLEQVKKVVFAASKSKPLELLSAKKLTPRSMASLLGAQSFPAKAQTHAKNELVPGAYKPRASYKSRVLFN